MSNKKKKLVTKDTFQLQFGKKSGKLVISQIKYKPLRVIGQQLNGKPYIN